MTFLISLWAPILLSAVFVFVLSSIIHMVFTYHNTDFVKVPEEDEVMSALRRFNIPPGDYVIPWAGSAKAMGSPEFIEKSKQGPVAFVTFMASGVPGMGKSLGLWFLYCVLVGIFSAYITDFALGADAHYLKVFRIVGTTAFMGYAFALLNNSIWYHRKWSATLKSMADGLAYALVTAGTFGWLWP